MNRRQFIATTATGSAGYVLGAKPTSKTNSLTLGFSLYGMKTLKTGEALRRLSSIGYDSVELCLNDGWDAAPEKSNAKTPQSAPDVTGGSRTQTDRPDDQH